MAPAQQLPPLEVCCACDEPQPAIYWHGPGAATTLLPAWEQAAPIDRYCGGVPDPGMR
jgi:hypothetical protein